ncbi:hypothetical protein ANCCEY_07926 [Ancylostoma ceylanicum]|uniref:Uncharacterized protein n=1 Tax=Ancylostoma ceylanicum TaxID=53326 RepID=A0A0D6LM99_9BILA|nr:hypothetical protein ANCCEY_07926 [Ancylostoma ceylanicum]
MVRYQRNIVMSVHEFELLSCLHDELLSFVPLTHARDEYKLENQFKCGLRAIPVFYFICVAFNVFMAFEIIVNSSEPLAGSPSIENFNCWDGSARSRICNAMITQR